MIYEKAYAKINLALEVGKKENGYHQVKNLMVPISLYDELFFEKSKETVIQCEKDIPDNLCLKAFEIFKKKFQIKEGVTIILKKNIPIMAGLAGGSSDAAATLRGLNRLFETKATLEELIELACELGSDVPFFLQKKAAICTGRGEVVKPLEFETPNIPFLLIKPNFGLSTKDIYSNYVCDGVSKQIYIDKIILGLKENDFSIVEEYTFNDLEKVALKQSPLLEQIFRQIEGLSYEPHVSGSGPSIFILNAKAQDLENVKAKVSDAELFLCHTI